MPLSKMPVQTVAQRANVVYRVNTTAMAGLYLCYGLNFLVFPHRTSIVQYGGLLASPVFWGVSFVIVGALMLQSLIRPDVRWLFQISQMGLISLTVAWLITRCAIALQSGLDLTGPLVWLVLLISDLARLYLTHDIHRVVHFAWIDAVFARFHPGEMEEPHG